MKVEEALEAVDEHRERAQREIAACHGSPAAPVESAGDPAPNQDREEGQRGNDIGEQARPERVTPPPCGSLGRYNQVQADPGQAEANPRHACDLSEVAGSHEERQGEEWAEDEQSSRRAQRMTVERSPDAPLPTVILPPG